MNGIEKILSIVFLSALLGACGGPKIVSNEELAQIFHDVYLTNSYISQHGVNVDSLNIYEPIFAHYGYTSEDIQYTIGSFAKRKSARLSNEVVEVALNMLRRESRHYQRRMAIRDTIVLIAKEKFAEPIYFDSLIRVRRVADTARLSIVIPDIRRGSYKVSYNYFVDSLDRNLSLRTDAWLLDTAGRRSGGSSRRLDREKRTNAEVTLVAGDAHRRLVIALNGYPKDLSTPNLTVDSLIVKYYLPEEIAVRKLARSWYGGALDSLFTPLSGSHETHFVAPLVDTARIRIR